MATQYAVQSASGTLVASTAQPIVFNSTGASGGIPIRYGYVYVQNTGTSGNIYVRTDGNAATAGGDYTVEVAPGAGVVVANSQALWTQAANVIAAPSNTTGTGSETPFSDFEWYPNYGTSPYGGSTNPGTSVSIISAGTPTYTVSGAG